MSPIARLQQILNQVAHDSNQHIRVGLLLRKEAKYIKSVLDRADEAQCANYVAEIEASCPELRPIPIEQLN